MFGVRNEGTRENTEGKYMSKNLKACFSTYRMPLYTVPVGKYTVDMLRGAPNIYVYSP